MITVLDHKGVVHAANAYDKPGHCLCGYPPHGIRLSDPAPQWDMSGSDEVTCPRCLELSTTTGVVSRPPTAPGSPSLKPGGIR